jgi:hypothetical protein
MRAGATMANKEISAEDLMCHPERSEGPGFFSPGRRRLNRAITEVLKLFAAQRVSSESDPSRATNHPTSD